MSHPTSQFTFELTFAVAGCSVTFRYLSTKVLIAPAPLRPEPSISVPLSTPYSRPARHVHFVGRGLNGEGSEEVSFLALLSLHGFRLLFIFLLLVRTGAVIDGCLWGLWGVLVVSRMLRFFEAER